MRCKMCRTSMSFVVEQTKAMHVSFRDDTSVEEVELPAPSVRVYCSECGGQLDGAEREACIDIAKAEAFL